MNVIRLIIGYIVGFSIFGFLIPFGFYELSGSFDSILNVYLFGILSLRLIFAAPFLIIGLVFVIWSNLYLLIIGKGGPTDAFNISISPRTRKLVTTGPYKYSRNPMVFGMLCIYLSIAIILNSAICLIIWLMLIPVIIVFLRFTEEKRLFKDFGEEYLEYRRRVSMIFPLGGKY
jgi:protein-S-isoprenylcysteine O-methyltransferase Ste14